MHKTQVFIDPSSRILYASFYIHGLYQVFGKKNVFFAAAPFTHLNRRSADFSFEHYFAFVIHKPGENPLKIVLDFCDPPDIHAGAYTWCDRYAKINFNLSETAPQHLDKLIPIPPGFGIKIWNLPETFYHCFKNLSLSKNRRSISKKRFLQDYFQQFKRPRLEQYTISAPTKKSKKPYVFMIASLWADEHAQNTTNVQRKNFIGTIKQMDCNFEGGFYANPNRGISEDYKPFIFSKRYSSSVYLDKTKASYLVFNTPAVHGCFGWKLAEFLAMGKAIISTPLRNDLFQPLSHKSEIHIVDTEKKDLKEHLLYLFNNNTYRRTLEENSKAYFEKHASPEAVIKRIISFSIPVDFSEISAEKST